jgi:hypothetical protein
MRTAGKLGCIALLGCCCAVFLGAAWVNSPAPLPALDSTLPAGVAASLVASKRVAHPAEARDQTNAALAQSDVDNELRDYTTYKYRYLFATGSMDGVTLPDIEPLLAQREAACRPDSNNSECIRLESQLKEHLHPADHARYLLLKDSDAEQHHTMAYADGIQHLEPLNAAQERALLETRLRMKEVYQVTVNNAPQEVRLHALNQYQSQLLGELKPLLSEEQFALLSSYEQTEFETVRQRLLAASP